MQTMDGLCLDKYFIGNSELWKVSGVCNVLGGVGYWTFFIEKKTNVKSAEMHFQNTCPKYGNILLSSLFML